jgi:ketosteroid isomerase-like protein
MSESTNDVLGHHLTAFGEGDVEEILKDYNEDSILLHPDGVVKGLQQVKAFFTEIFEIFVPGDYSFEMKRQEVHGDVAYIVWKAETPKLVVELGTDTFVVRNSKIAVQTFAGHMVPK